MRDEVAGDFVREGKLHDVRSERVRELLDAERRTLSPRGSAAEVLSDVTRVRGLIVKTRPHWLGEQPAYPIIHVQSRAQLDQFQQIAERVFSGSHETITRELAAALLRTEGAGSTAP